MLIPLDSTLCSSAALISQLGPATVRATGVPGTLHSLTRPPYFLLQQLLSVTPFVLCLLNKVFKIKFLYVIWPDV